MMMYIIGGTIYAIGLIACLTYLFFEEDADAPHVWMALIWPIVLAMFVAVLPFMGIGCVIDRVADWRRSYLRKLKSNAADKRRSNELKLLEASSKAEQIVKDYRTPASCIECGK